MSTRSINEFINASGSGLIGQIDHVNYVVAEKDKKSFIDSWVKLGFNEVLRVQTQKYPGEHIVLTSGKGNVLPWGSMTALTVSDDPESPSMEFINRHGPGVQYYAYSVSTEASMNELHDAMKAWGWNLMCPVLSYMNESGGQRIRLIAVAPAVAWGPFVVFIQRVPNEKGELDADYDIILWETLFDSYADVSRELSEK